MNELLSQHQRQKAIAKAADNVAARHAFEDYRQRKSFQTKRRQDADLRLFSGFLEGVEVAAPDMHITPESWMFITWGLVKAFVSWMLQNGYAVATVNVRLSTIKVYAGLALQAGAITAEQHALIQTVKAYSYGEGINLDQMREVQRIGKKKAQPVEISHAKAQQLKSSHEDDAQGHRDRMLMNLLLDHGMRIGEVAMLTPSCFNAESGIVRFWRPKVKAWSRHELTADSAYALELYLPLTTDPDAPLMRQSIKTRRLTYEGVTSNRLSDRVREIAGWMGVEGMSAHDCRHYWATRAAMNCKDPFQLQEAGGWSSLAMPRRYIKMAEIANKGITL